MGVGGWGKFIVSLNATASIGKVVNTFLVRAQRRIELHIFITGAARHVTYVKSLWRRRSERRVGERAVTLVKQRNGWRMSCDVCKATEGLENELWRWWVGEWALLYISIFMSSAHSPNFPSLYLCHNSFSNPSVALPTSQLILKPFRCFTYVKYILQPLFCFSYVTSSSLNSPGELALLILQPFRHFTYVTTHSPTLPSLYLHHSSFSNPSVASSTSQFILQPFFRFSYVTSSSLNSPGEPPMAFVVYFFNYRFWEKSYIFFFSF